jgi:hypothetical protein
MTTTTLDDLKIAWNELSQKLEWQNALALRQFKETRLARFRSGFRPLVLGQLGQLIIGLGITAFSATYWVNHLGRLPLLICGLFLQAYGIMFIAFAVRDLFLIRRIDYAAPVIEIQKELAELRAWHLRAAVWHGLTGSVVWLPVMIILLHGFGADESWISQPHKVIWLLSSIAACLGLNYGLIRLARSPGRCGRALRKSWIGSTVNRAQAVLDEIEEFEREAG